MGLIEQAISFMNLMLSATLTNCLSTAQHPIEPCLLVSCLDPTMHTRKNGLVNQVKFLG